jgi:hypothetical protein
LTVDVRDRLSDLAVEELGYIVDDVRRKCAGAPADLVVMELRTFQRVRQLEPDVVHSLAAAIADETRDRGLARPSFSATRDM